MADAENPQKKSGCARLCQSKLCLPAVLLAVAAGVAVVVPVVLLDQSVRERYPPDLQWWQTNIVYQIYPRSFQDSDDDGTGDLQGITSRLYYFTYLNVKAIWISPFYPSPMKDFGYDVSNFTDIDPLFGTLEDFDVMLKAAHQKGMKVIIDFVAGHTSSQHEWFQLSVNCTPPYQDYYIWDNGTTLPNGTVVEPSNWVSVFGGSAWEWSEERQQYYYHAFLAEQPTLNYRYPPVVDEMKDVLRFWLERGVDGIRVDAVNHIMVHKDYHQDQAPSNTPGFQQWEQGYWNTNLTLNQPEIGDIVKGWREVLDSFDDSDDDNDNYKLLIVELYEEPEIRNRYYGYGADMPFNFKLATSLDNLKRVQNPNYCDAICIRDVIQIEYDKLPEGKWTNFVLSNHDMNRVRSRMGARYVDVLNMLLLTLRGTPTTYYGDEIGMEDISVSYNDTQDPLGITYGQDRYQEVSRDPERSPMQWDDVMNAGFTNSSSPWLQVHPQFASVNVETEKTSSNTSSLQVYRALAVLRHQPSLRYGLLRFAHVSNHVLSYLRLATDQPHYLVILNVGNATVTDDFSGPPVERSTGKVKVVTSDAANEGRFSKEADISLTQISLNPGDGLVVELPSSSD